MSLLSCIDAVLFGVFFINIFYLFIFSIASHFSTKPKENNGATKRHFAIFLPAYKEDAVILESTMSCINQSYPQECYDVIVISDSMESSTNNKLQQLPVKVIEVNFEESTKAKALNFAIEQLESTYDIAVVLDADNIIAPDFLTRINAKFQEKNVEIVQAHRCAKNMNTPLALLDAASEEINNSIFRKGHVALGLSAALIGSGMAFDYQLFKETMARINAVGGFDRALELLLLRDGKRVHYLHDADVQDEKVQQSNDFARQRRRWLSAQLHYLLHALKLVPGAIKEGRWDFCDKVMQQAMIPRVILLGITPIMSLLIFFVNEGMSVKWWILLGLIALTILCAIPRYLYRKELLMAIIQLPYFFILMIKSLLTIRGANKTFIHTQHGINTKK